jgi:hypothetical protein
MEAAERRCLVAAVMAVVRSEEASADVLVLYNGWSEFREERECVYAMVERTK